ncbi:MAG TPA: thioredoxin family protein [Thermoanaerobaculia bacterium]|nr:thioredoxin family protein [Thermoanaerobaculia bacterium]
MRVSRSLPTFVAALAVILLALPGPSRSDTSASKAASGKEAIRWRSIASGDAEAKKSGKPALYFFTASWCGPCRLLEGQVFAVPEMAAQIERDFVPIEVADRARETGRNSPEMLELADRYGLRGFPTLVVSRPGLAASLTFEGWHGRGASLEFLKTAKKRFLDLEKKPH